ncbi:MAG: NmrA family NAD(P)-binding protein, partial [Myxococcota bacterium]
GIEVVEGSFKDGASLGRAMDGVDAVFAMGTFFEAGVDGEVADGLALVGAAKAAKVPHVVYTSVASADRNTGIPHFDSKGKVEAALIASGVPWTILAPVYFMENLFFPQTIDGVRNGVYAAPLTSRRALQQVAVADIGALGVVAIERGLIGRRIELAGDELDGEATAAALAAKLGKPIRYQPVPLAAIEAQSHDLGAMYRYFEEVGYAVNRPALRREFPDVGWHSFADWLAGQTV